MSTRIYFVRRGRTYENLPGETGSKHENRLLAELTTEGRLQADLVARALEKVEFEQVYASPYYGAVQTAILIADRLGQDVKFSLDGRIIKRGSGSHEVCIPQNPAMWDYSYAGSRSRSGEETLEQMESRVSSFVSEKIALHSGKNILVVSHGGVARVFCAVVRGRPQSGNLLDFPYLEYGHYMTYEYDTDELTDV